MRALVSPIVRTVLALFAGALCVVGGAIPAGANSAVALSYRDYVAPAVSLVRTDGRPLSFANLVDGSRPVVLEFFYTSCTTICGMQASTLALARRRFGPNAISVSITIDPEYDTPLKLRAYGSNFNADTRWFLLTGRRGDILKVLSAFDARPFGDNKMLHRPLVFIRPAKGRQWVRMEGLANADQIVAAYNDAARHPPPMSSTVGILHEALNKLIG